MIEELKKHLTDKNIDPSILDDFVPSEDAIEEDLLADALDTLSKAMKKQDKSKKDDDDEDDDDTMNFEDEDEDEDMEKGGKGGYEYMDKMKDMQDAMNMMAKGTDSILADMEKRFGAIAKGLENVLKEMQFYRRENKEIKKSLSAHFDLPVAPRAVSSMNIVRQQTESIPQESRQDLISKALTQLQDPEVDSLKKSRLLSAVSRLESGAPLTDVLNLINN
mgnify:CR=1 FL=1|jgi:hypothetical protein|tara:strand:+ start:40 stop:699 length:660 start_codon:yes stop_codon:yes gene_type:complete